MGEQVRSASVFVGGRKVGQFSDGDYGIASGDEPNYGDNSGVVVYSDGIIETKLTMKTYEPVDGIDYDITGALLAKTDLQMTITLINGMVHQVVMRPLGNDFSWQWKNGVLHGSYTFGGSAPKRT
jgi:hypothetical protein